MDGVEIMRAIKYKRLPTFCYYCGCIGHDTQKCLQQEVVQGRPALPGAMKLLCWNCRGLENHAIVRELRQLLGAKDPDIVFLCETKLCACEFEQICIRCNMDGCFVVESNKRRGWLALLWKIGVDMTILNQSMHHIDSIIRVDGQNQKLSLVDIKPDKGWFTWTNNQEGRRLVKERIDRFLFSADWLLRELFVSTEVVRQARSYEACWFEDKDAKDIIKSAWCQRGGNLLSKIKGVGTRLGEWQHCRFKRLKSRMRRLVHRVERLIDGPRPDFNIDEIRTAWAELGQFYLEEEAYWSQRSRIQWLKEGDRNTRFFHV
ncbi:hypothetical protein J1N35_018937 [Gossypium stocksii]|uniref:Zinc knuckle CX2CX4HX4C domain-containing protein n=1 Tax=Gossypium stocksii TaxID=47602 RepID=A0A9D3VRE6_9ROSI|nr:hypothetical protein J1N35_018937 [Gossypium stocksii]